MRRSLIITGVALVVAGGVATVALSANHPQYPRFCGWLLVGGGARLPIVVLRGHLSCRTATDVIGQNLLHSNQHPNGWFCADDTGPRLQIGKVEHCRYPTGTGRAEKFVQAYDPNEFNPDQH